MANELYESFFPNQKKKSSIMVESNETINIRVFNQGNDIENTVDQMMSDNQMSLN